MLWYFTYYTIRARFLTQRLRESVICAMPPSQGIRIRCISIYIDDGAPKRRTSRRSLWCAISNAYTSGLHRRFINWMQWPNIHLYKTRNLLPLQRLAIIHTSAALRILLCVCLLYIAIFASIRKHFAIMLFAKRMLCIYIDRLEELAAVCAYYPI